MTPALAAAVIIRAVSDAEGRDMMDSPKNRARITAEAKHWLTADEHAEQRESLCLIAGVDTYALRKYVSEHGLGAGIDFNLLRSYRRCDCCGKKYEDDEGKRTKYCSDPCREAVAKRNKAASKRRKAKRAA
ncbi:hypothetical protein C1J03_19055 [Sulfitobacter sp. SK012]|uniref:hypothetical protein n=1 Tax=Sulfitobacter sp. SK012 TaxID=1389005 RepID=UPI000E0AECA9|nr:hypothetical protein [Sulfitobacter sp. SK012]AXI47918.1 hypothetical protein C1J03_19055 [Sulfitobacter sp. SK012]